MTLEQLNQWVSNRPTLADALGIELTALTDEYLEGRMPVDGRTHQPWACYTAALPWPWQKH